MSSDAEAQLRELIAQAERHRNTARDYRVSGRELDRPEYATIANGHDLMFLMVCNRIRRHCVIYGLQPPDWVREEKPDDFASW